jgi:hypothetical protein
MNITELGCEGVDWIYLAHHKDQCSAHVYTEMEFWFSREAVNFRTS